MVQLMHGLPTPTGSVSLKGRIWPVVAGPQISVQPLRHLAAQSLSRTHEEGGAAQALESACYRRNVGICLVNREGLVFSARRQDDKSGAWQMPQGGIDLYEGALDAAKRELKEETGVTSARVVSTMDPWLHYDFPTSVRNAMTGSIRNYKGQTQKWVLMYFYGHDEEIDLEASGEREFLEYRWTALEDLPQKIVPFKASIYQAVAENFGPLIRERRQNNRLEDGWWSRK